MNIAVIGGGVAGLATAIRLSAQGHRVTIFEKNISLGGKVALFRKNGFTWDGGPSFFTDPETLLDVFRCAKKDPRDYFAYFELDEACRYWYEDDIVLNAYSNPHKLAQEMNRVFGEPTAKVERYLEDAWNLFDGAGRAFIDQPLTYSTVLSKEGMRVLRRVPKDILFQSLHALNTKAFRSGPVVTFFDRFATYNGSDPWRISALFSSLPALEHVQGAFQPKGGMYAIISALKKCAEDSGVRFEFGQETFPVIQKGECIGVNRGGDICHFDKVVTASEIRDVFNSYDTRQSKKHEAREHSASAYVMYLGVKKPKADIYLHNIFFSDDYARERKDLWISKKPSAQPTIYLNNTSYFDTAMAPKDHQNWFVMVNVPPSTDDLSLKDMRKTILDRLSYILGENVQDLIVEEYEPLTPQRLETLYRSFRGSIYGLASNSFKGAFLRPKNKSSVRRLYHAGVTVHPGGGIPLALRSARIVSDMIGSE